MNFRSSLWIIFCLCISPGAFAELPVSAPADAAANLAAPVTLDGEILFHLRGISAYPAKARAKDVAGRIHDLAADPAFSAELLKTSEAEDRTHLMYGDRRLVSIVTLDAEREGVHRSLLAEIVRAKIVAGIERYRREREPEYLLGQARTAGIASLGLLVLFVLVRWGFRRLRAATERRFRGKLEGLETRSQRLFQARQLAAFLDGLIVTLQWVSFLAIAAVFVDFVLGLFPWTRAIANVLLSLVVNPLRTMWDSFLATLPDLGFLLVLGVIVRYLLKLARLFFEGIKGGTIAVASFEPDWAWPTYRIVRLGIIAFALVIGYPYIPGSGSEAFKGISIFLGVIFSLGSSSFISNIIAGYTMTYRKAFRIGDRIRVEDHFGDVTEVGVQVTRLRTPKNEEIVLPNSEVLGSNLINYSALAKKQGLILYTTVGIGYETPWRQVEAMLLKAAERTEGLLREPAPFVLQKQLGDFSVTYELNAFCDRPQQMLALKSAMHRNILDIFNEHGVQIMTPAYEGDPAEPKIVAKENWFAAPANPVK